MINQFHSMALNTHTSMDVLGNYICWPKKKKTLTRTCNKEQGLYYIQLQELHPRKDQN